MSDYGKPSKSNEENTELNIPSTSTCPVQGVQKHDGSLFNDAAILTKSIKIEQSNVDSDGKTGSRNAEDIKNYIAEHALGEVLERCDRSQKDNQISIIFSKEFDSLTSSVRTLKQSQSCFSNTAMRCIMLQNFSSPSQYRKWDSLMPGRLVFNSKIDTATQSSPHESAIIPNSHAVSRDAVVDDQLEEEIHISASVLPPSPIIAEPPLEGAPPSYSAVMRIGSTRASVRRLFGRRVDSIEPSAPFISPNPPPTYAEAQGHYYRPVLVDSDLLWGPDPMPAACQRCGTYVITQTTNQRSNMTHFAALALCICGCWPCCLLPYCMNSCKNTYHYCPNCNSYLGMYRPWN